MRQLVEALKKELREADDFFRQAQEFVSANAGPSQSRPDGSKVTKIGDHAIEVKVDRVAKKFVSFLDGQKVKASASATDAYQAASQRLVLGLEKALKKAVGHVEPQERQDLQARVAADFFKHLEKHKL